MQGISWLAENRLASQEGLLHGVSKGDFQDYCQYCICISHQPLQYPIASSEKCSAGFFVAMQFLFPSLSIQLWISRWPCVNGSDLGLQDERYVLNHILLKHSGCYTKQNIKNSVLYQPCVWFLWLAMNDWLQAGWSESTAVLCGAVRELCQFRASKGLTL